MTKDLIRFARPVGFCRGGDIRHRQERFRQALKCAERIAGGGGVPVNGFNAVIITQMAQEG